MTKQEFIKKWNIAFEDKEQETEFAAEMSNDLNEYLSEWIKKKKFCLKNVQYDLETKLYSVSFKIIKDKPLWKKGKCSIKF